MIRINFLDINKNIEIPNDITNGNLQKIILNKLNLTIFDITCLIFKYSDKNLICGYNDLSFYSKFNDENLEKIIVLEKNSTNPILIPEIDYHKIKEYFNTYLISLDDEIFINNSQQENLYPNIHITFLNPYNLQNIINHENENNLNVDYENENDLDVENENDLDVENENDLDVENENNLNVENENNLNVENENNLNVDNENEININLDNILNNIGNLNTEINLQNINSQIINPQIINPQNILNTVENNLFNILSNAIITDININNDGNIVNTEQEDVKIIMKDEDFENIEVIDNLENEEKCSICLDNMENKILKLSCGHFLHKECGREWLCKCSNKCPICKKELSEGIPLE